MKIRRPTEAEISEALNAGKLLEELNSKVPKGAGIAPEDMVTLARIIFDAGVNWTCKYYQEQLSQMVGVISNRQRH